MAAQALARSYNALGQPPRLLNQTSGGTTLSDFSSRVAGRHYEAEVLRALTKHYRQRHWCRVRDAGPDEGGPMPST